jgi:hypothetical protein
MTLAELASSAVLHPVAPIHNFFAPLTAMEVVAAAREGEGIESPT